MNKVLSEKYVYKKILADNLKETNKDMAVHCYYYELLLRLKDFLLKNKLLTELELELSSSHELIMRRGRMASLVSNRELMIFRNLKRARNIADYHSSMSFNRDNVEFNKSRRYDFYLFMRDYKKIDEILSEKGA